MRPETRPITALGAAAALAFWPAPHALADPAEAGPPADPVYENADADLARDLANPVASLISLPVQLNIDRGIGPDDDGTRTTTNFQPVLPFSLNAEWNLISRTIMPVVSQSDVAPGSGSQFGLGDVVQTVFLSPSRPTAGGLIWGVGPVMLLPTATDDRLGTEKWGAGPSAVALLQRGPWTAGALANHVWSFAGADDRAEVNRSLIQPFVSYTTPDAWTFSLQSESVHDWEADAWAVPVNVSASKLVRLGKLPVNLQAGLGYWVESPAGGPEGVRFRLQATVLLPR